MPRVVIPTDNPKIELINGWVKAKMYSEKWHKRYDTAEQMIDAFVKYYNNQRPAYALNYKTPHQYKFRSLLFCLLFIDKFIVSNAYVFLFWYQVYTYT